MIRKTLTILSLIGLVLSVGLWGVSPLERWYAWETTSAIHVLSLEDRGVISYWLFRPASSDQVSYIPLWIPTVVFAFLVCACCSVTYLPFHRRRKRKKLGLCVKCGYDLRASKERCPECGTAFETP